LRTFEVSSIVVRGIGADNNMVNTHPITMFQTEVAVATWSSFAANVLGTGRPAGPVSVFARRRAR
jgi:hypothetical protein